MAILFRRNITFIQETVKVDPDGRYLNLIGHINSASVTLINIYGRIDYPEILHKVFQSL